MVDDVLQDDELKKIENDWKSEESLKIIQGNWEKFEKWCEKLRDDQQGPVRTMLEHFGERACLAPASSRFEYHNAFPGGLVDHSLRVMNYTVNLAKAWKVQVEPSTLIMSTLFHDWGKVGTKEEPYYVSEQSDWHRKRGKTYNYNTKMNPKAPNAQLGLFVLNQFQVRLSDEEYFAILLNDGQYTDSNSEYKMKEPKLALLVHFADRWATQCEKFRRSLLEPAIPKF